MTSCELDFRLPSNNIYADDDDRDSEDDENRLQIVELPPQVKPGLYKSISTGVLPSSSVYSDTMEFLGCRDSRQQHSSGSSLDSQGEEYGDSMARNTATDAVESLLLLGQGPVFGSRNEGIPKFEIKEIKTDGFTDQKLMVNYYQKMRERNNEASKRCRLKRRIKQDSLEKTKSLLESHREALGNRIAKLRHIKEILSDACRAIGNGEKDCECHKYCTLVRSSNREMPDLLDFSSSKLIKKSKLVRETNIEEILGEQAANQLTDLKPLKRGPRKQDEKVELSDPQAVDLILEDKAATPMTALDLSTPNSDKGQVEETGEAENKTGVTSGLPLPKLPTAAQIFKTNIIPKSEAIPVVANKTLPTMTLIPKTSLVPLAPKQPLTLSTVPDVINGLPRNVPARKIIVDNPNALTVTGAQIISAAPSITFGPPSTISLGPSNTIILTPLTHFNPVPQTNQVESKPEVEIKSEPDISLVEVDTEVKTENIKVEPSEEESSKTERDPTKTCCASKLENSPCSNDLIDLNTLTQTLDLMTMEPKMPGDLTAAEKNIIKSRLSIEFWMAEESATFICSAHRESIVKHSNLQACSVCGKKRSRKLDMFFITYRMAVEFYMTAGKFLSIGLLACSCCKIKTLKGLDFSNSYVLPPNGMHPLDVIQPTVALEAEDPHRIRLESESEKSDSNVRGLKREGGERNVVEIKRRLINTPHVQEVVIPQNECILTPVSQTFENPVSTRLSPANPGPSDTGMRETNTERTNEAVITVEAADKFIETSPILSRETVQAAKDAITRLLSTLAPGQETSLWNSIMPELDSKYK